MRGEKDQTVRAVTVSRETAPSYAERPTRKGDRLIGNPLLTNRCSFRLFSLLWMTCALFSASSRLVQSHGQTLPDLRKPTKTIGIVIDGPSLFFEPVTVRAIEELESVASDDFDIQVKQPPEFSAEWDPAGAVVALNAAMADPEVDVILAAGVLVTQAAAQPDFQLIKPVISAFIQKTDAFGLPYTESRRSAKRNFSFVVSPNATLQDLFTFQSLIPFKKLHALVEEKILNGIPQFNDGIAAMSHEFGTPVVLIPSTDRLPQILERIDKQLPEIEALYFTPQIRLSEEDYATLIRELNARKIPTFSLIGHREVEEGILAGQFPNIEKKLARRVALNINRVLLGEAPENLSVYMPVEEQLLINAKTAAEIGYSPDFQTLISADFLHKELLTRLEGEPLTLEGAMEIAASQNVDLDIAQAEVESARQAKNQSRSPLFPQIEIDSQYQRIDGDRAAVGFTPERRTTAGATLRQLLYSDEVLARFRAATRRHRGQQHEAEMRHLDVKAEAAQRFLDYWAARELLRVEAKNLSLSRDNLNLARLRSRIGAGEPEEVYRWESNVAQQRSASVSREAAVRQALTALNQSLGFNEQTRPWTPVQISIENLESDPLVRELGTVIHNRKGLDLFRRYAVQLALGREPVLLQLSEFVKAQEIILKHTKRQFLLPTLSAQLGYDRELNRAGRNGTPLRGLNRDEWLAALVISIPLFEGGNRISETRKAKADLRQLQETKRRAEQLVELRVHSALYSMTGSRPSIDLSRTSATNAALNLEIIRQRYIQGTATITDLVNAQTQAFAEERRSVVSTIEFLRDWIEFQRATARFKMDSTKSENEEWLRNLKLFIKQQMDRSQP